MVNITRLWGNFPNLYIWLMENSPYFRPIKTIKALRASRDDLLVIIDHAAEIQGDLIAELSRAKLTIRNLENAMANYKQNEAAARRQMQRDRLHRDR